METKDIRLANLNHLLRQYRRDLEFCKRVEMNPSYLSQIKTRRKAIGDEKARKMESQLGLPRGWFDALQDGSAVTEAPPGSDALATAHAIQTLPAPLRDQMKRMVMLMAAYTSHESEDANQNLVEVGPFSITGKVTSDSKNTQARKKGRS